MIEKLRTSLASIPRNLILDSRDFRKTVLFMSCIENYVPLQQFHAGEVHVTFYEDLCTNPHDEMDRICSRIGAIHRDDFAHLASRLRNLIRKDNEIVPGFDPFNSWRKELSGIQIKRAFEVSRLFGLDALYADTDMPFLSGADAVNALPAALL